MAIAAQSFPKFLDLPAEIREIIWRECLPRRVVEIDGPYADSIFHAWSFRRRKEAIPCSLSMTSALNTCPPLITRVCRESRTIAFKSGVFVEAEDTVPVTVQWYAGNMMRGLAWRDSTRDSLHLNWDEGYTADFDGHEDEVVRPMQYLEYLVGKFAMRGSFRATYLHPNYGWTIPAASRNSLHEFYRLPYMASDRRVIIETLSRRAEWLVVMRSVIIHASMKDGAASGLFGLLGDAPVQLFDIAEQDKIDALYKMARACQVSSTNEFAQDLHRDTASELEDQLSEVLKYRYGVEEPSFRLRPAIMFHLCPLMCHQPGKEVGSWDLMNSRSESRIQRGRGRGGFRGRGRGCTN